MLSTRVAVIISLFFLAPVAYAVLTAPPTPAESVRDTIVTVRRCDPTGGVITLTGTSTILIYDDATLFPPGAVPAAGQAVFALTRGTRTCDIDLSTGTTTVTGLRVLALAVAYLPPTQGGGGAGDGSGDGSGSGSGGQNGFGGLIDQIKQRIQAKLNPPPPPPPPPSAPATPHAPPQGVPFGGPITEMQFCETPASAMLVTLGPPTPGKYLYIPGYSRSYMCGPPSIPGQYLLGSADPAPQPCDICFGQAYCPIPGLPINSRPGHGSSCPAQPAAPSQCSPQVTAKGTYCSVPEHDKLARDSIRKYGKNLMSGNVPGIEEYCPNYSKLNQQQREDFWVRFIGAVQKPESGCNPKAFGPEPELSAPSQGLLQLSYGDGSCHPGACSAISKDHKPADIKTPNQSIYDPKNNLDCGIAIMDCYGSGGVTTPGARCSGKSCQGMDKYWSVLRRGAKQAQIQAETRAFPGCMDSGAPQSGGPSTPTNNCAPTTPPPAAPSTSCNSGPINTPAQKLAAERTVRQQLKACGISVNKGACPFNTSFRDTPGGCTDVGGMQCSAIKGICELAAKCPLGLTGGNELGHKTHTPGNAADINTETWECIKKNFVRVDNCHYRDPATGTTFLNEELCPVAGTEGGHVHVCFGGRGC